MIDEKINGILNDINNRLINEAVELISELTSDVEFLFARCNSAGCFTGLPDRDVGLSSNSIVSIAYEETGLEDQVLPSDMSDLMSCERMWDVLPEHRKTEEACEAMKRARNAVATKGQ